MFRWDQEWFATECPLATISDRIWGNCTAWHPTMKKVPLTESLSSSSISLGRSELVGTVRRR
jgi:hypothetical protein